jgi:hypothetical protein
VKEGAEVGHFNTVKVRREVFRVRVGWFGREARKRRRDHVAMRGECME